MRTVTAVLMIGLMFDVMISSVLAATYIKVSDEKIGTIEEVTTEMSVSQIKAEINACNIDIGQAEDEIARLTEKKSKLEEMLATCATMGIAEPVKETIREYEHIVIIPTESTIVPEHTI